MSKPPNNKPLTARLFDALLRKASQPQKKDTNESHAEADRTSG